MKIVDKILAVIHYVDGRTDEGFLRSPVETTGQYPQTSATLMKDGDVMVFVNLSHVINIEQKFIYK